MKKLMIISGGIWAISGILFITIGSTWWFHFPYLLFLDGWHFTGMILTLCFSLLTSQIILDTVIRQSCLLLLTDDQSKIGLKQSFLKFFWSLSSVFLIEIILKILGISQALMGLVTLGIGVSFLWSSRFYGLTVLQTVEIKKN